MIFGLTYPANRLTRHIVKVALIVGIASCASITSLGVSADDMLMNRIAGHRYERRAYNADRVSAGRTVFSVSEIVESLEDDRLEIRIRATSFDANDRPIGTNEVVWYCNRGAAEMFMNLLILAGERFKRDFRVTVQGGALVFPAVYEGITALPDVELDIEITTGFLALLGTRTRVTLTDRSVIPFESQGNLADGQGYKVLSNVQARVFVLRIPVKRYRMKSEEWVSVGTGLVRQMVTFSDGGYSETQKIELDDAPNDEG